MSVPKYSPGDVVGCNEIIQYMGNKQYLCRCINCDTQRNVFTNSLNGKSCYACYDRSARPEMLKLVDGLPSHLHYLYVVHKQMLGRGYNPKNKRYNHYGAKGIGVCDRWRSGEGGKTDFQCFVEDIHSELGLRPNMKSSRSGDYKEGCKSKGFHLGRKDHDLEYQLGNVRWETGGENTDERIARHRINAKYLPGVKASNNQGKFRAYIYMNGDYKKPLDLGSFATELEAHEAYCSAYRVAHNKPCPHKSFVSEAAQYYNLKTFNEGDSLEPSCAPLV